jgi:hypothetical protein
MAKTPNILDSCKNRPYWRVGKLGHGAALRDVGRFFPAALAIACGERPDF